MLPTITTPHAILQEPGTITVIVGRNGAGKSKFLRNIISSFQSNPQYNVSYLTPERGGSFLYEPNIEANLLNDPGWLSRSKQNNQFADFKKTSVNHLRNISMMWGRRLNDEMELRQSDKTFQSEYLEDINALFLNVKLIWEGTNFRFIDLAGNNVPSNEISSGESEAASLASEILNYFDSIDSNKNNIFAIDEPDVHLHPDMQVRLANFIVKQVTKLSEEKRNRLAVIIATHSTSIATAFSSYSGTKVATKYFDNIMVQPRTMAHQFQQTAKFFAHPLSQIISEEPLFIIEGEDDTRVFQQAARSAQGRIRMFPIESESVNQQGALETFCSDVLGAIHDDPHAYSIRDGDGVRIPLDAVGCVSRFRLQCYAIENLLLTDEFLQSRNSNWANFQVAAIEYANNMQPGERREMIAAITNSDDRFRDIRIKDVRTLICVILGSDKPWEFLLGQVIGNIPNPLPANNDEHSIINYLGRPLLIAMGLSEQAAV